MSTIAAGTTSGTALVSTGNTDGTLQLQVNGTTPSVTLAANGAIGVGSTPGYGTNGQVLTSSGTGSAPTWTTISSSPTIVRSARTSNTILGTADASTLIAITSGTFTQTFTAAATLGSGWFCYIQNLGTGEITLDPNASETIDGLTSYIMYPNEVRLVQCNGTSFFTVVLSAFIETIDSTGTFVVPPGYSLLEGLMWGGGGGGKGSGSSGGGGGGACVPLSIRTSVVAPGTSVTVTIANGGTGSVTTPGVGGNSTFGAFATSYGGGGGNDNSGGGGGGVLGAGVAGGVNSGFVTGGLPFIGTPAAGTLNQGWGGGAGQQAGAAAGGGKSVYGGGGGGGGGSASGPGGSTIFGGAGGSGSRAGAGGTSVYGGAGGTGNDGPAGGNGSVPGGGGGGSDGSSGGNGGAGRLIIWGSV